MSDHARGSLGTTVASPALLTRLEEALASLGAALGANDPTNIERQLRAAAELGATRSQLEQAIETAHNVQESAARIHLREAERLLDTLAPTAAAADVKGDSDSGCSAMVELFAASRGSDAMAGCREMFQRFTNSGAAPEETKEPPTATTAAGSCKKEALP